MGQLDHHRSGLTQHAGLPHERLAELEALHTEAVVLGGLVLLDVAARFEGGEQPEGGASNAGDDVVDAEFEEVKDDDKK